MAGSNMDMNAYSNVLGVNEADSTITMVNKMAQLMLKGYSPEAAYQHGVHKKRALSYKTACDLVLPLLESQEPKYKQAVNLAKAYANLGKPERTALIGKTLVKIGDYKNADKVFRYGKIKQADVLNEMEGDKKESYLNHVVQQMKTRREKSLIKRKEKASEELLVPVALQIERLDKRLKQVKEERGNELGQYEKMKGEYSNLLGKSFTPENGKEFYENAKNAGKLWGKISKRYGSNEDLRNPKKSKLTEFTEKMVSTSENLDAKAREYSENEMKYHEVVQTMETRYKQKLQKDAEKLGYKGELFPEPKKEPEWKKKIDSGEISTSKAKDRKYLRSEALIYLKKGEFQNAHDIYANLGTLKDKWYLNRMNKYLKKDSGNEEQAAKDYYGAKMRVRKIFPAAVLTGALIGAIAGSFIPHKHTTYKLGPPATKVEKDKTLQEKNIFINVERGGNMWNQAKKLLPPGASNQEIAGKTREISAILGLYNDSLKVVDGKVMPGADGIYSDVVQPGKYKVGTKLEIVPIETKTTYKPVVQTQENAPWPNYGGTGAGAGIGALAGLGVAAALRRRQQEGKAA